MAHQIHTYSELRQQIHHDLRIQHPEWVQPNGESPMCDFLRDAPLGIAQHIDAQGASNESVVALQQGLN